MIGTGLFSSQSLLEKAWAYMSRDRVRSVVAEARVKAARRRRPCSLTPQTLVLLGFVTASLLLGRGFTAFAPGHADAKLFAYIGRAWLQGSVPYVDVWDNKPPGIFATNALVFALFPDNFTALAVVEGLSVALCLWSLWALMRRVGAGWAAATVAAACAAIACNLRSYNEHGNSTEIYVLGPAALSMLCFVTALQQRRLLGMFWAGLCTGLATLYKPPGLAPFLAQVVFLGVLGLLHDRSWRLVLRSVLLNAGGLLLAWVPCLVYFWWHGVVGDLLDASLLYNLTYGAHSQRGLLPSLFGVMTRLQPLAPLTIGALLVAAGVTYELWRACGRRALHDPIQAPGTRWGFLALLWAGADLAGAMAGGRNYAHYFLPLTASLSLLGGLTYWRLTALTTAYSARLGIAALLLGPLLLVQVHDANHLRGILTQPYAEEGEDRAMAFLTAMRQPTDTLFTWDGQANFHWTLRLRSPSRYLSADYLRDSPVTTPQIWERLRHDLAHQPPSFVVDKTINPVERAAADPAYCWFQDFLAHQYHVGFAEGSLRIYVLERRPALWSRTS